MLLNCGVGEDSWESLGLQGDSTSPSLESLSLSPWRVSYTGLRCLLQNRNSGFNLTCIAVSGLPMWLSNEESACHCRRDRRLGFNPRVAKIPWRRKGHPTPVFLPGESHAQRSLVGYSPWGRRRVGRNLATKQPENANISLTQGSYVECLWEIFLVQSLTHIFITFF